MKIIGVIATKNRFELFKKAINSVLNQKTALDDLIVVSDSAGINYYKEQEYLKEINCSFIKDQYTHNYAGNLNTALSYIVNKYINELDNIYIAFLDDDDTWDNEYITKLKEFADGSYDFIVAGLIYNNENGQFNLDINEHYELNDFLKGNPGIQGSNTFIKLSTLLKAGCFDENLSSTTDRDLFCRVMMLNPKYKVLNEYLVNVDAFNDRTRITNSSKIKIDGLSKFYYKYSNFMDESIKQMFFERAYERFNVDKDTIIDLINYRDYKMSGYKKHKVDSISERIILRKMLIDKIYANDKDTILSRVAFRNIKENRFNIFSSGLLLETPLYNASENFYSTYSNKSDDRLDYYFNSLYSDYINPKDLRCKGKKWLLNIIENIVIDEDGKEIIYRSVIDTLNHTGTFIEYDTLISNYLKTANEIILKMIMNEYRICGLNNIINIQYDYHEYVSKLVSIKNELMCEYKIRGLFDYLKHIINKGKVISEFNFYKEKIVNTLNIDINTIEILGNGAEGCVFTDKKKIYKWYMESTLIPSYKIIEVLTNVKEIISKCPLFYKFDIINKDDMILISYDYHPSRKLRKIDKKRLFNYIKELEKYNISIDNVKIDNFIVDEEGIKFIDFGSAIMEYNQFITKKGLDRIDIIFDLYKQHEINYYFYYNKYYYDLKHRG